MPLSAWLVPLLLARGTPAAATAWLDWQAPSACPRSATIERRVDELLAGGSPGSAGLRVSGEIRRDGDAWVLRLVARTSGGVQRRRLRHTECALLGEAAALLVAMAVDPVAVVASPRLAGLLRRDSKPRPRPDVNPALRPPAAWVPAAIEPPEPPRPEPTQPPTAVAPASPPAPPPIRTTTPAPPPGRVAPPAPPTIRPATPIVRAITLRLSGGLALGATPAVAGGIGGAIGLGLGRRARLELPIFYTTPTRASLASAPQAGALISLAGAGLRGCGVPGARRVEVPLCLGAELGSMRATGFGVDDGRSPRSLWAALTPGLAVLVLPRPWLALGVWLDVPVALVRPRFFVGEGGGEVWRARPAGLRAGLGVEVRIPADIRRRG